MNYRQSGKSGAPRLSEPSSAFETQVKHCAKQSDSANDDKVAVLSFQLGHIFEFMPDIPAIAVGTASIAAQAANCRVITP